jgi:hypothetical protein
VVETATTALDTLNKRADALETHVARVRALEKHAERRLLVVEERKRRLLAAAEERRRQLAQNTANIQHRDAGGAAQVRRPALSRVSVICSFYSCYIMRFCHEPVLAIRLFLFRLLTHPHAVPDSHMQQ